MQKCTQGWISINKLLWCHTGLVVMGGDSIFRRHEF